MILLIDNYDSFSYNLYQLIGELEPDIKVIRNDEMTVDEIRALKPEKIILSPGPGRPENAGILLEVINELGPEIPILGVCLGHQAICMAYGAEVTYAKHLMHGKQSEISIDDDSIIFRDCPKKTLVARYHSLSVNPDTITDKVKIIASTKDEEVMAVQHIDYQVYGMQFHPESIMTPDGKIMIKNFIKM